MCKKLQLEPKLELSLPLSYIYELGGMLQISLITITKSFCNQIQLPKENFCCPVILNRFVL